MPFYNRLNTSSEEGKRIVERLLALKTALKEIPEKTLDETLLLATWNLRDFDKPAYGRRSDESIYYIAEIIGSFDIVAIQEVYRDMEALDRVRAVLGGFWKFLVTDTTEGSKGNNERMAYLYDSRKVKFGGLAGELVLPDVKAEDGTKVPAHQVWRTPYICGFKAGWSRFMLCTVHILWGRKRAIGGKEPADRIEEIRKVAQFLKKRTNDKSAWSRNLILLGDFNIFTAKNEEGAFGELAKAKFEVPESHRDFLTNASKTRGYDQIAFRIQKDRLATTGKAGVFDFFKHVYTERDQEIYADQMGESYNIKTNGEQRSESGKRTYYKTYWRTHQMSDHLPLWVELKIDFSETYLKRKQQS